MFKYGLLILSLLTLLGAAGTALIMWRELANGMHFPQPCAHCTQPRVGFCFGTHMALLGQQHERSLDGGLKTLLIIWTTVCALLVFVGNLGLESDPRRPRGLTLFPSTCVVSLTLPPKY